MSGRIFDHYRKKIPHDWTNKDRSEVMDWVKIVLNYNGGDFHPLKRNIVSAEQKFKIEIQKDWAKLQDGSYFKASGIIDLVTEVDKNTIEILDYKSGMRKDWNTGEEKTHKSLREDIQLLTYYYASRILYPDKHVMVSIFYIKDGGVYTIGLDDRSLDKTEYILRQTFEEIKNNKKPRPNYTWRCERFCGYSKMDFSDHIVHPIQITWDRPKFKKKGENCSMCEQIVYELDRKPLEQVTEEYRCKSQKK